MGAIPEISIRRLCQIFRLLDSLRESGREIIFSDEIGEKAGMPSYQVRKDISYLGVVGKPGRGYNVQELLEHIQSSLNLCTKCKAVIVGVGRLGSALLNYANLAKANFEYIAAFDSDSRKKGKTEGGTQVLSSEDMSAFLNQHSVDIGVITVPQEEAQNAADSLIEGGITAILNFAPVPLKSPENVVVRCIDFSLELNILTALRSLSCKKK